MTPRHSTTRRGSARHARSKRRHPLLRGVGLVLVGVLATVSTAGATAYTSFQRNIDSADVDHLLGPRPPETTPDPSDPNAGMPVNILVLGSDTREGNSSIAADAVSGQRADTTIVMHVSGDRERVEMVSIPRDSLVDIPACRRSDGTESAPQPGAMFNGAFATGGENGSVTDAAACAMTTVEQTTGVRIHHFVVVDMGGFVDMVDALGGVPMCIPHDMRSRKAKLDLTAGNHVLDGPTALALARARTGEGLGDGSDTGRIERQQELLAATAREALGKNLLTDVPELYRFLSAVTRSLTVSSGIASIPDLAGFATSLRGVSMDDIAFMTIPWAPAPNDPARVVWTDEADEIWAKIAADQPLIAAEDDGAGSGDDGGTPAGDDGASDEPSTPAGGSPAGDDEPTTDDEAADDEPTGDQATDEPERERGEPATAGDLTVECS